MSTEPKKARAPFSLTPQQLATLPITQRINLEALIDRLEAYADQMAPGKMIDPRDGAGCQQALWNAVRSVFMAPAAEFNLLFSELLITFHRMRGQGQVFNEMYLFRFFTHMRFNSGSARSFERIMNLLLVTCNPATRRLAVAQMDLAVELSGFNDPTVVEKVNSYFHTL